MANPADNTYAIIREAVEGTTPATPAFKYLDYIPGNEFALDSKMLNSDVLKQNRAMAGVRKTSYSASGSIKTQFRRDASYDMLLESAFSGTFATNVLKASNVDSFHTIEKRMLEGATPLFWRYNGMQVTKFGLTVDAESNAEANFDFIGAGRTTGTAIVTGATYAAPAQGVELDGTDVGTMTIAGLTGVRYMSLDLSVEHTREAKFAMGSPNAFGTGTSGFRTVKLTVKLFRADLSPETVFLGDTPVAVSFSLGTGVNGYKFDLPAVVGSIPKDEVSGSKALVSVEMTATFDATTATDIMLTKLA
jgi:hypothetical protein